MITLERATAAQTTCACGATMVRIASPLAAVGLTAYTHALLCDSCGSIEFAPVDPDRSTIRATSRLTSVPCSNCTGPISELPNPYYGVKRAQSSSIRFCGECDRA